MSIENKDIKYFNKNGFNGLKLEPGDYFSSPHNLMLDDE